MENIMQIEKKYIRKLKKIYMPIESRFDILKTTF